MEMRVGKQALFRFLRHIQGAEVFSGTTPLQGTATGVLYILDDSNDIVLAKVALDFRNLVRRRCQILMEAVLPAVLLNHWESQGFARFLLLEPSVLVIRVQTQVKRGIHLPLQIPAVTLFRADLWEQHETRDSLRFLTLRVRAAVMKMKLQVDTPADPPCQSLMGH